MPDRQSGALTNLLSYDWLCNSLRHRLPSVVRTAEMANYIGSSCHCKSLIVLSDNPGVNNGFVRQNRFPFVRIIEINPMPFRIRLSRKWICRLWFWAIQPASIEIPFISGISGLLLSGDDHLRAFPSFSATGNLALISFYMNKLPVGPHHRECCSRKFRTMDFDPSMSFGQVVFQSTSTRTWIDTLTN